jgi:hypothetical protein
LQAVLRELLPGAFRSPEDVAPASPTTRSRTAAVADDLRNQVRRKLPLRTPRSARATAFASLAVSTY